MTCPFCGARSAELVSLFGSQLLLSQYRCLLCRSYFEGLRPDRWEEPEQQTGITTRRSTDTPTGVSNDDGG